MSGATVNEVCDDLIKRICSSNLTYQINQTPYSIYLSIRKKFVKEFDPNVHNFAPLTTENSKIALENENIYVKYEYQKLVTTYLEASKKFEN